MEPVVTNDPSAVSVQRKCQLAGLAHSSYYRHLRAVAKVDLEELTLRDQIQRICLEMNRYGYRRVRAELHRRGFNVNHKRVLALMRRDNLLCLRKKRWRTTTDSQHGYRVYPNLLKTVTVTGVNQVWIADITYVRLPHEFVYLAVVLDAYSRRAIGWALRGHLDTALSLSALQMALETRTITSGLIHHSDRGVQYAATDYTALLTKNGIAISMSRKGNPYDNAKAESFMKTLKYEEVLINEYQTIEEAQASLAHFIEIVYNHKRLHSALDYKPPVEFENDFANSLYSKPSTLTDQISVPL